jgi:hypothetical protein
LRRGFSRAPRRYQRGWRQDISWAALTRSRAVLHGQVAPTHCDPLVALARALHPDAARLAVLRDLELLIGRAAAGGRRWGRRGGWCRRRQRRRRGRRRRWGRPALPLAFETCALVLAAAAAVALRSIVLAAARLTAFGPAAVAVRALAGAGGSSGGLHGGVGGTSSAAKQQSHQQHGGSHVFEWSAEREREVSSPPAPVLAAWCSELLRLRSDSSSERALERDLRRPGRTGPARRACVLEIFTL